MEATKAIVIPASGAGTTPKTYTNGLQLRFCAQGYEVDFTDGHANTNTASTNMQPIIAAVAEAIRKIGTTNAAENPPVITHPFAEGVERHGASATSLGSEVEIEQLRQQNQKLEGNLMKLQKLLQSSKQEIRELKVCFQSATHMKAADIAKQFSQVNVKYGEIDYHTPGDLTDSGEPYPSEYTPEVSSISPRLQAIDFCSLDDILDDDKIIDDRSKRTASDMVERDDGGSLIQSDLGDDEIKPDELLVGNFELSEVTPPSIMKVGLDVEVARIGGECRIGSFHGSPLRGGFRGAGRYNNCDLYADRDIAARECDDLPRYNDGSMVTVYGIMYKPDQDNGTDYKSVLIGNLPRDINYQKLLERIRGGAIISATICDTTKLKGSEGCMSALVVFIKAASAKGYVQFANKHGIYFGAIQAAVEHVNTPTFPLSVPAEVRISYGHTRYLVITRSVRSRLDEPLSSEPRLIKSLSPDDVKQFIDAGVNRYRCDAMERIQQDKHGNVHIWFASISASSMAYWRLRHDPFYRMLNIRFDKDPCDGPLSELLPNWKDHRFMDCMQTVDMKLNYGNKDDSEDEYRKYTRPGNPPIDTKLSNADEIELVENEASNSDRSTEGKTTSDKNVNQKSKTDIETTVKKTLFTHPEISIDLKAADISIFRDKKLPQVESSSETQASQAPSSSKDQEASITNVVPKPYKVLKVEDSPAEDVTNPWKSATLSATLPQILSGVSEEASRIITAILTSTTNKYLKSQADDINAAVEAVTVQTRVEDATKHKTHLDAPVLTDVIEEMIHLAHRNLQATIEEDLGMCNPVKSSPATEILKETPVAELSNTAQSLTSGNGMRKPTQPLSVTETLKEALVAELSITEQLITTSKIANVATPPLFKEEQAPTPPHPLALPNSPVSSPAEAAATRPSTPNKYDLTGTNIDPALLPRFVLDQVLSRKPQSGLASSRWADPPHKLAAAAPKIIVPAPRALPLLSDAEKGASDLLFGTGGVTGTGKESKKENGSTPITDTSPSSVLVKQTTTAAGLAPLNAPKGPRRPGTVDPHCLDQRVRSRYGGLAVGRGEPRPSLRGFFEAVDNGGVVGAGVKRVERPKDAGVGKGVVDK